MAPAPNPSQLIATVVDDAGSDNPLDQLFAARSLVFEIEAAADEVLGHFVERCRESGLTWSEISSALGVTKQAAHRRYAATTPAERALARASSGNSRGLARDFEAWCASTIEEIERIGFHPGGWIGLIQQLGAAGAAHQLLQRGRALPVFHFLVKVGRSELSLEYAALQPEWAELFAEREIDSARSRLTEAGVDLR